MHTHAHALVVCACIIADRAAPMRCLIRHVRSRMMNPLNRRMTLRRCRTRPLASASRPPRRRRRCAANISRSRRPNHRRRHARSWPRPSGRRCTHAACRARLRGCACRAHSVTPHSRLLGWRTPPRSGCTRTRARTLHRRSSTPWSAGARRQCRACTARCGLLTCVPLTRSPWMHIHPSAACSPLAHHARR